MDKISYQNGFVCGMATRGLARSGQLYEPLVFNDSGVYTYFYIDFRRAMQVFSIGMLTESIIVYDSVQISIMNFEKVNETTYKIYANIAGLPHGITVINKKTSRLRFANGDVLPPFSTHVFVTGQTAYIDGGYLFDTVPFVDVNITVSENSVSLFWSLQESTISESTYTPNMPAVAEMSTVVLK